jgi:hypothetical protein
MLAACESEDDREIGTAPGQEATAGLCLETTSCHPPGEAPAGSAYLVNELTFVAPDRLATEFLRSHMAEAVNSGELVLVLHFQQSASLLEPCLEAGPAVDAGSCHVFEDGASRSDVLEMDAGAFRARAIDVRLLMHNGSGEPVLDLVLPSSTVEGLFTPDGLTLVGGRGTGHGDRASIESVITVEQARAVDVPLLGMTFCGLLSGATGAIGDLDDDCVTDPETWPSPPTESITGRPAYRIEIAFGATCIPLSIDP